MIFDNKKTEDKNNYYGSFRIQFEYKQYYYNIMKYTLKDFLLRYKFVINKKN